MQNKRGAYVPKDEMYALVLICASHCKSLGKHEKEQRPDLLVPSSRVESRLRRQAIELAARSDLFLSACFAQIFVAVSFCARRKTRRTLQEPREEPGATSR